MIVVSNTSPITNLAAIHQFDLLHLLYGQIHIPDAVWAELNSEDTHWPGRDEVAAADWIETHTLQNRSLVNVLRQTAGFYITDSLYHSALVLASEE